MALTHTVSFGPDSPSPDCCPDSGEGRPGSQSESRASLQASESAVGLQGLDTAGQQLTHASGVTGDHTAPRPSVRGGDSVSLWLSARSHG